MTEHSWIKNNRNYTLKDSDGSVLLEMEDRTCNGVPDVDSILNNLAKEYFEGLEKERNK